MHRWANLRSIRHFGSADFSRVNQLTFYITSAVGLLIGGALLYFVQHIRLGIVMPSLAVAALIMIGIGVWGAKCVWK